MKNRLNNQGKHGGGEKRDDSVVSGQWSVVSGQWSVVSGQWSVVSGQLVGVGSFQSTADELLAEAKDG